METPKFVTFSVTVRLTVQARMPMEAHTVAQSIMIDAIRDHYSIGLVSIGDIVPAVMPHRRTSDRRPIEYIQRDIAGLTPGAAA